MNLRDELAGGSEIGSPSPGKWLLARLGMALLLLLPLGAAAQLEFFSSSGETTLAQGEAFAQSVGIAELLGPLAPVALSPFFGITLLSGASLLGDTLPIPDNALLDNPALKNPAVFLSFLALSVLTSLPKLTKVSKPLGQAIDQLEAYAGIATIVVLQWASTVEFGGGGGGGEPAATDQVLLMHGGVIAITQTTLIMIVSAVNLFVVNTVKFFFEVLIWLSPIPTVDAFFEVGLKVTSAALIALYAFSPELATAVNVLIFLVCLVMFRSCLRISNYYRVVLFGPVTKGLLRAIGLGKAPTLTSTPLPGSVRRAVGTPTVVLPVYPARKKPGMPKRVRAYLINDRDGNTVLVRPKLLGGVARLDLGDGFLTLSRGLIANVVLVETPGDKPLKLTFSKTYNPIFNALVTSLGAMAEASASTSDDGWQSVGRSMGRAMKSASGGDLKQELA